MIECILNAMRLLPAGQGFLTAGSVEDLSDVELLNIINEDACARWVSLLHRIHWISEPLAVPQRRFALLGLAVEPSEPEHHARDA